MKPDTEGVHCVAKPGQSAARADIVFVHGLGGSSHATWTHGKDGSTFFWPEELGKDLPDCAIWTVGYPAGFTELGQPGMILQSRANNISLRLANAGLGNRPIVFVTHSMGGLIVKYLVVDSQTLPDPDRKRLVAHIRGIVFCATPHRGSDLATAAGILGKFLGGTQAHVKEMEANKGPLDHCHDQFIQWHSQRLVPIDSYAENIGLFRRKWFFRLNPLGCVVPRASANPNIQGHTVHDMDYDHLSLVKPPDRQHDVYAGVLRFIQKSLAAQPVPPKIPVAASPPVPEPKPQPAPHDHQSPCQVGGMELKHTAPKLFGRDDEKALLDAAWARVVADERPRACILAFVAWGGVGKTSLVSHWLEKMAAAQWQKAGRVFVWSFYSQGTRDTGSPSSAPFLGEALRFFGDAATADSAMPAREKGARIAELAALQRTLLVLDGLEPLQFPPGARRGEFRDEGLAGLFSALRRHPAGLCVVTTREPLAGLAAARGQTFGEHALDKLSDAAGAELLHSLGVRRAGEKTIANNDRELIAVATALKGHALALTLLGTWLAQSQEGDIRRRDNITFTAADEQTQGGHAFKILRAYETWLEDGPKQSSIQRGLSRVGLGKKPAYTPGQRMLALLRLLGFFDRAAEPAWLATLLQKPPLAGITGPLVDAGPELWRAAVDDLVKLGLVTKQEPKPRGGVRGYGEEKAREATKWWRQRIDHDIGQPENFDPPRVQGEDQLRALDAHPLLREHFARRLQETAAAGWRTGHGRLADALLGSVPYWPEGEQGLQPLYQAVLHGTRAGRVQEMCAEVYRDRIQRGAEFYSTKKLGLHSSDLGVVACFFAQQWQTPSLELRPEYQAWLLNEAAFRLRAVGRLAEAVEPLRVSVEMAVKDEIWGEAAIRASNLSQLELTVGAIGDAVRDGARGVELADRSGDEFMRMVNRTVHGDALHHAGQRDAARDLFAGAETVQEKMQPEYPLLYSVQGYRYCDLLLADAALAGWRAQLAGPPQLPLEPPNAPVKPHEVGSAGGPPAVSGGSPETSNAGQRPSSQEMSPRLDVRGEPPRTAGEAARAPLPEQLIAIAERATRTLGWATQQIFPLDIALDHLTLARVALYRELLDGTPAAETHFQSALLHIRAAGGQDDIPLVLLPCAWWRVRRGETVAARDLLDEAEEISRRGGMKLFLADTLLHRALLFRAPADLESSGQALKEAGDIIQECGYHRRKPELDMLR